MVNIEDVNDNDPVFDVLDKEFSIVEGNATVIGTVFGSVRAIDVDVNNTITYSLRYLTKLQLISQDEILTFLSRSSCDDVAIDKNGQLTTTGLIDRETNDVILCQVMATDSGTPTRSSNTNVCLQFPLIRTQR